jgi:hypothetical protein
MSIERDSVHFRILARLCAMPKPVRGISGAMLERHFGAPGAVEELAGLGLIQTRGWANGPGMIWIPTAAGEALYEAIADGRERWSIEPAAPPPTETDDDGDRRAEGHTETLSHGSSGGVRPL